MFSLSTVILIAIGATPTGRIRLANLPDETLVHLGIALKQQDADGLNQLLAAQRDPSSPSYHAWLDPQAFGARFGLSESDYASVTGWFSARGFAVTRYPNRSFFEAVGRVDDVRSSLGVQVHTARLDGREFRTFEGDLALPAPIAARILHISGLDTRSRPRHPPHPRVIASGSDAGVLGPDDLRLEYDMTALIAKGTAAAGLSTAVLGTQEGTTTDNDCFSQNRGSAPFIPPAAAAIQAYFTLANATATYKSIVLQNGNDDFDTCGANQEYELDVEMQSVGAANAKTINLVLSPSSEVFTTGAQYIVNHLPAVVAVSTSLGLCESNVALAGSPMMMGSEMQVMQQSIDQGLAEGQMWFAASGDNGADDCHDQNSDSGNGFGGGNATVDFPGALPEIMDMGGAQFNGAASWGPAGSLLGFVSEAAWNELELFGGGAGGGGQSLYYAKPAYQVGVGPEAGDGARDVPDLALEAASGTPGIAAYFCGSGQDDVHCGGENTGTGNLDVLGGTSVASPLAAGMFALLAGEVGCSQGDIHAEIYALGTAQQNGGPTVFNDITSGDNDFIDPFGDTITGFSAGTGYDLVTGWGSIDLAALIANWPTCPGATTTTSTGTSTGAATSSSAAASSSSTGGQGSSTGTSSGGGSSTGSSAGSSTGSSTGAKLTLGATSTSGGDEISTITVTGCACGSTDRASLLLWTPLVFGLFGFRRRQRP